MVAERPPTMAERWERCSRATVGRLGRRAPAGRAGGAGGGRPPMGPKLSWETVRGFAAGAQAAPGPARRPRAARGEATRGAASGAACLRGGRRDEESEELSEAESSSSRSTGAAAGTPADGGAGAGACLSRRTRWRRGGRACARALLDERTAAGRAASAGGDW